MKTYQITLPDESAALVDKMLQDGPWESIDELFLNSIGSLQEDVEADDNIDIEELREKLLESVENHEQSETMVCNQVLHFLNERTLNKSKKG